MNGLAQLVDGLFDYAGMFPPASLTFEQALAESAKSELLHRPGIVGNDLVLDLAVVPKLTLEAMHEAGYLRPRLRLCIVGVSLDKAAEVAPVVAKLPKNVDVTSVEVHAMVWDDQVADLADTLACRVYFEPKWPAADWPTGLPEVLDGLTDAVANGQDVGLKFRCAGPTALDAETLAIVLPSLVKAQVPLKATQGLHHPLVEPTYGNAVGFVGLAVAIRMLQVHGTKVPDLVDLLRVGNPRDVGVADGLAWRGLKVPLPILKHRMDDLPFAIGSCSLAEPDADMRRLWA